MPQVTAVKPGGGNDSSFFLPQNLVHTQPFIPGTEPLNSYDRGLREGLYQPFVRGYNQPWYSQVANAALRLNDSITAKVGEGFAGTVSLLGETVKGLTGQGFSWNRAFDNGFTKLFSDWEKDTEAKFPIYGSQKYLQGNLADKVWTSSFWTQDAMDGLEFLASAYLPGAALSKIGSISKLSSIGKMKNLSKILKGTKAALGAAQTENFTGVALSTLYNTTSEAMIEGSGVYKEIKEDLKQRFPNMPDSEIEAKASKGARDTFAYNMAALMLPNFLENKWMHGKSSFEDLRKLSQVGKITDKELKSNLLGSFGKGFASEGLWEENIQTAISEYEKGLAEGKLDPNDSISKNYIKGITGFLKAIPDIVSFNSLGTSAEAGSYEDQAATAVLLGGIMGGPFSLMSDVREKKALKELKSQQETRLKDVLLPYMGKAMNQIPDRVGSILKTYNKNADGTTKYADDNGNLNIDPEKLRLMTFNHAVNNKLEQQAMAAATKGDTLHLEHTVSKALSNFAWQLGQLADVQDLSSEDMDYLIETKLGDEKDITNINKESGKQLGLGNTIKDRKSEILQMVEDYKSSKEALMDINDFSDDKVSKQYKKDLHRALYYATSTNRSLNKLYTATPNSNAKEALSLMIEDNDKIIESIKNSNNRKSLFEDYKKQIAPMVDLREQENKILREWQREKDPAVKEKLKLEHDVLSFKMDQLRAIEGTEDIQGELSNPDTNGTFTSRMFGNRQTIGSMIHIPAKQLAQWAMGNGIMIDDTIQEQSLEKEDPTSDEGYAKLNDLFSNYISSNKPLPGSQLVDEIFNNIQSELTSLEDIKNGDFDAYLENQGIDLDKMTDDQYSDEQAKIDLKINKLNNLIKYKEQYDNAKNTYSEIVDAYTKGDEEFFQNKFLFNDYLLLAKDIMSKALLPDGTLNKEIVEEVDNVTKAINKVNIAKAALDPQSPAQSILDSYSDTLEKVRAILLDKAAHRAEQQVIAELQQTQAIADIVIHPKILSILSTKYPNLLAEVEEAMKDSRENRPFQLLLKILDEVKSDKPLVELILKELEEIKAGLSNEIVQQITLHPEHRGNLPADYFNSFLSLPSAYTLSQVLLKIFPRSFTENLEYPFREFRNHLDLFGLESKLDMHNWNYFQDAEKDSIRDEFKRIAKLYRTISEIQFVKEQIESKVSAKNIVEAETELVKEKEISPTFQQRSLILRLIHWFGSPANKSGKSSFSTSIAVRGIIGTGKTRAVLHNTVKLLMKLGLVKSDEVILVGHSEATTKQLNQLIKGVESSTSIEDYLANEKVLDNIKLLVVDESAAIPNLELTKLVSLAKDRGIKVILAGDASQNKAEINPEFTTNLWLENTTPLSVAYRSNIASLTNAALAFKDKLTPVDKINLQSNKSSVAELLNDSSNALGVMNLSTTNIVEILSKKSSRTRKLIVTNKAQVQKYKQQLPDVEVVDYLSVQGTEAEEVYLIIDNTLPNPLGQEMSTSMFNTAMYTSIGRGTKFVGVNLVGVDVEQIYSDTLADKADSLVEDFKTIEIEHIDAINKLRELLGMPLLDKKSIPSIQQAEEQKQSEDVDEDSHIPDSTQETPPKNEDKEPSTGIEGLKRVEAGTQEYLLMFPTNPMLPTKSTPRNHIDYSTAFIIKDPSEKDFLVVVKDKNYAKNKKVYPIAVLGEEELDASKTALGKVLVPTINRTLTRPAKGYSSKNFDGFIVDTLETDAIGIFPITESTSKLTISYKDRVPFKLVDTIKKFINQLLINAKGSQNLELSKELNEIFKGSDIDWDQAIKQELVSIKVYNEKEAKKVTNTRFIPEVGVPYLVIEKLRTISKNQKQSDPAPFHIELKPKKYNSQMNVPYMEEYLAQVKTFLDSLSELKSLLPNSNIELNNVVKDNGNRKEGTFARMLDSYAKKAYEPSVNLATNTNNVSKKQNFDINEWLKSNPIEELSASDMDKVNKVIAQLDLIVPLVYGVSSSKKVITFKEYKELVSSQPEGTIGQFIPTVTKLNNKLSAFNKRNPDADLETRAKEVGISDDTNVYYQARSGTLGEFSDVKDLKVTRGEGPIQNSLNVLAAPNSHLSIHTQLQRRNADGTSSSYGGAKNLFSIERKSGQYYTEIRNFLTEEVGDKLLGKLFTPESIGMLTNSPAWNIQDYYYGQTMFDGKEWNGQISLRRGSDGRLTFGIQDDNKVARPEAILFVAQAVVDYVKTVTDQKAPNEFDSLFQTTEQAQQWYDNLLARCKQIEAKYMDTSDPVTTKDLEQIVEQSPDQTYTNLYTPILKNGPKIAKHKQYAVSNFGKLKSKEDRAIAEQLFETAFESVSATKIGIDLKTSAKEETPQQPLPPQIPPRLSPKRNKVDPIQLIEAINNGDMSPAEAIDKLKADKLLTDALRTQINNLWAIYYTQLALKPGAKKYQANAQELLDKLQVTDPLHQKLKDLVSLYSNLSEVEIFEIQTWKSKGIKMFAEFNGDLWTDSLEDLLNSPAEFLHELIHVITVPILDKANSELTKAERNFKQEIEVIFKEAKKNPEVVKLLERSPSGATLKEFIANLPMKDMYNTLVQMGLPKKGKGITKILKRIWGAIIKYFTGDTKDLASATFASFQNFMETQYQKTEVQQEVPTADIVSDESYPELRDKLKKLKMDSNDIQEFIEAYEAEDEVGKASMEKGINTKLIKKGISFTINTVNKLEEKGFFKKEC